MALFAISDLHLSFSNPKPMDVFSPIWENHPFKIKKNWESIVNEQDTVLIPGDISWASKLDQAKKDLEFISKLPGKKILTYGNHDYWWSSISKMNDLYKNLTFIKNDIIIYEKYIICCTRGWLCPNDIYFLPKDNKIYLREANRLERLLQKAQKFENLEPIVMLHFPPTNDKLEDSLFTQLIKKYNIRKVIFGHIHNNFENCFKGEVDGVNYNLVSADFLNFSPAHLF